MQYCIDILHMHPVFFKNQQAFRKWLADNHQSTTEIYVGYYKKSSSTESITWSESVDQALCFGWIDSVKRTIDTERYCIRFTPRKAKSIWSEINIKKVKELEQAGLMQEAGMQAYNLRYESKTKSYYHETEIKILDPKLESQFKLNEEAWDFFSKQSIAYRRMIIHWIMAAKQEKTRISRTETAIKESLLSQKIKNL